MVDVETVCCMCGDVGFSDKLFRCNSCRHRFQHNYCSSYYKEYADPVEVCDWCQSEERRGNAVGTAVSHGGSSKKSSSSKNYENGYTNRSEYPSGDRTKQPNGGHKGKTGSSGAGGVPSPRTATRRYKLLKDVMC